MNKTISFLAFVLCFYTHLSKAQSEEKVRSIKEVIITNESDPEAIQLLKKVKKKYKQNSPKSLDSYEFTSYQKISFDVDKDSIMDYKRFLTHHQDSLKIARAKKKKKEDNNKKKKKRKKKDSLVLDEMQMMNVVKESQFFLWERAQQHLYSKKHGDKINLLDNRISGLRKPIYELLTIRTNLYKIPKEIRPENFSLYLYHLKDNIVYNGRESYVIKFRERRNKAFRKKRRYNGYIYIDKATLGIVKIESDSREKGKGSIRSEWVFKKGKWFLDNEQAKINMGTQSFAVDKTKDKNGKTKIITKKFGSYIYVKSKYFNILSPSNATSKDFKGYTYSVKNTDGSLLDKYRTDSLSLREKNAYVKIDSIGKKFKIDKKVTLITSLLRGKLRTGYIDWDISKFIGFNHFEGFRLGASAHLNEKFSKVFSPNAYFAYGFKDKGWKYGVGLDIKTSQNRNALFKLSYADDVMASGRFNEVLWNTKMRLSNQGIGIHNNRYFSFQKFKIAYEQDLTNSLSGRITAKKMKSKAEFDYQYKNHPNQYKDTSLHLSLKYSPNSKNVMTPMGKYTYQIGYPEVYFNYEKGIKTLGGKFDYHRFDMLFTHKTKGALGTTRLKLYGGYLVGDTPIYNAFEMGGLKAFNSSATSVRSKLSLSTFIGFATMESGKYFNDRFASYAISHRLPFNFVAAKSGISNIDLVYKGEIGDFKNKNIHQLNFKPLNHLYQEVGFEYNNILNTRLNLGFFYRIGHYHQPKFMDNFAVQFKIKMLEF